MGYWQARAGKMHRALLSRKLETVSSAQVKEVAVAFGFAEESAFKMLVRSGALVPLLFKGLFHVQSAREMAFGTSLGALELAAASCNARLGKNWHFGLATALKLNGLAGVQTQTKAFIIAEKQFLPRQRALGGMVFEFSRITGVPAIAGVLEKNGLRYSSAARTVLDYLHLGLKKGDTKYAELVLDAALEEKKREFTKEFPGLLKFFSTRKSIEKIIKLHLEGKRRAL